MKRALVLTGWYCKDSEHWYPWLKKELERRGYKVDMPTLPTMHTDLPNKNKIIDFLIKRNLPADQNLLIGHSLGCLLGMKLAEKYKFEKLQMVAGWDFNDLTAEHQLFWDKPINHEAIKKNVKEKVVVHSNDPYITPFQAEEMAKRLKAKYVYVENAGHFTQKFGVTEIPELIKYF